MKYLIILLTSGICSAQIARFTQSGDTIRLERTVYGGREILQTAYILIQNVNGDTVKIDNVSLSDTTDFDYQSVGLAEIPLAQIRRIDIFAKRTCLFDTSCTITIHSNSIDTRDGYAQFTVYGVAGTVGVRENLVNVIGVSKWYTITGELADTTKTGIYFSNNNQRKAVVR